MNARRLLWIAKRSFLTLLRHPVLVLPSALLLTLLFFLSQLSVFINHQITSSLSLTLWLSLFNIIALALISFFFTGLIALAAAAIKEKPSFSLFFSSATRFCFKNFLLLLVIIALADIIFAASTAFAFFIGKVFSFSTQAAQVLFFLLYIAGLAGILSFLTFSNIFLVLTSSLKTGIMRSISLVKRDYPYVLSITLIFFVAFELLSRIPSEIIINLIASCILIPYFALFLTHYVLVSSK